MKLRVIVATLAAVALLGTGGCGGKGPKLIKVSGTVKFTDGGLIEVPEGGQAVITFQPAETGDLGTGQFRKGASGTIGRDGRYELRSIKRDEGVIPGAYIVTIVATKAVQGPDSGVSLIPKKYSDKQKSELKFTVDKSTSSADFSLERN